MLGLGHLAGLFDEGGDCCLKRRDGPCASMTASNALSRCPPAIGPSLRARSSRRKRGSCKRSVRSRRRVGSKPQPRSREPRSDRPFQAGPDAPRGLALDLRSVLLGAFAALELLRPMASAAVCGGGASRPCHRSTADDSRAATEASQQTAAHRSPSLATRCGSTSTSTSRAKHTSTRSAKWVASRLAEFAQMLSFQCGPCGSCSDLLNCLTEWNLRLLLRTCPTLGSETATFPMIGSSGR
jgi:hypothetical protein